MRRRAVLSMLLAALLMALPSAALADGDPGSDVLLAQTSFLPSGDQLTPAQQIVVTRLLAATTKAGAPVRIAVIPEARFLGTVTELWRQPQAYANYLGSELADTYSGRLLVIMPNGLGFYWGAREHSGGPDAMATAAEDVTVEGVSGKPLIATIRDAVLQLERGAGVSPATLSADLKSAGAPGSASASSGPGSAAANTGSGPASSAQTSSGAAGPGKHKLPTGWFAVFLIVVGLLYVGYRTGRLRTTIDRLRSTGGYATDRDRSKPAAGSDRGGLFGLGISPFALIPSAFLLIVVVIVIVSSAGGGSGSHASAEQVAADNPNLNTGTALGGDKTAPNFTLYDQTGRKISLSQYRGKVVILSFVDAECQTICPLTTQAMLDAKHSLGAAAKHVQLLGVNANWKSNQINDVLTYTELHGMSGQWNFLTGNPNQLGKVWSAYGVNEFRHEDEQNSNDINHVAATYLISAQGKLERVFLTQTNYAAIPQFGQVLAQDAAALIPGHPKVRTDYSYARVAGVTPKQTTTLPRYGGGSIKLGPGKAHLYLFFDTWDQQSTALAANLIGLNRYQASAQKQGLPAITAIDEGSVEPNSGALPSFIKSLPTKLQYPVGIDPNGRVADGYDVEGEPWFVLTSPSGKIVWYQEVYTAGWPSIKVLGPEIKAALNGTKTVIPSTSSALSELAGSPAPLAKIHAQADEILPGGSQALAARIKALHGFPVVVNVWGSWCEPCQAEFKLFQQESAKLGKNVAFLGADYNDQTANAEVFLKKHQVWYPSYAAADSSLNNLLPGGVDGTPMTIFYNSAGKQTQIETGAFKSAGALAFDIQHYALGAAGCTACG
jgi:cytochrome oxidase Cu insertion factor (SCO1/SenC/PrrC family)/thiol-disulfide isomerase/thioredoxin